MELKSAGRLRPNPFTQHPSRNHRHSLVAIMIFAGQRSWLLPICFMKNGVFKSAHSSRRTRQETGTLLSSQSYRISFLACRLLKAAHNVRIVSKYLALGPRSNSPNLWSRSSPGELFRKPNEKRLGPVCTIAWRKAALCRSRRLGLHSKATRRRKRQSRSLANCAAGSIGSPRNNIPFLSNTISMCWLC